MKAVCAAVLAAIAFPFLAAAQAPKLELEVVAKDDGKPVAEIKALQISNRSDGSSKMEQAALSSEKGLYVFSLDGFSSKRILVSSDGFAPSSFEWTEPEKDKAQEVRKATLQLARRKELGGIFVDVDGKPVEGVKLSVFVQAKAPPMGGPTFSLPSSVEATSGKDGRWSVKAYVDSAEAVSLNVSEAPEGFALPGGLFHQANSSQGAAQIKALLDGSFKSVLKRGEELKGKVLLPDGSPAAGALVGFQHMQGKTQCKADGSFSLCYERRQLFPGCALLVAKEGYPARKIAIANAEEELLIRLEEGRGAKFRLLDETGKPVPEAYVNEMDAFPFAAQRITRRPVKSDGNGRFAIDSLPSEGKEITAYLYGNCILRKTVFPAEEEQTIVVEREPEIQVKAVDATTGEELKGLHAAITLFNGSNGAGGFSRSSSSQMEGQRSPFALKSLFFVMDGMEGPALRLEVRLSANGYAPQTKKLEIPSDRKGWKPEPLEFRMERLKKGEGLFSIKLLTPDGKPAAGAKATVQAARRLDGPAPFSGRESARESGADGSCVVELPDGKASAGTLVIRHESGGILLDLKKLEDGAEIKLRPYAEVSARMLYKGAKADNFSLSDAADLANGYGLSTASGFAAGPDASCKFDKVLPGPFIVRVSSSDEPWNNAYEAWGVAKSGEKLEIELGKDIVEAQIELALPETEGFEAAKSLKFMAQVRGGKDRRSLVFQAAKSQDPLKRLEEEAAKGGESFTVNVSDLKAGGVAIPLPPEGARVDIMASFDKEGANRFGLESVPFKPGELKKRVDLTNNRALQSKLEFMKLPRTRTVTGVVSYSDGSPAEGLAVRSFSFGEGEYDQSFAATTGKGGVFQVEKLPAAKRISCEIVAKEPYGSVRISFDDAEEPKEIVLSKASFLKGTVKPPPGVEAKRVVVKATWEGGSGVAIARDGAEYSLRLSNLGVPEGEEREIKVGAQTQDAKLKAKETKLKIVAGEDARLDLELERAEPGEKAGETKK